MSIAVFKKCHCLNDLSAIVIAGTPSQEEIQEAWNEILFEYASLIKTEETAYQFDLMKEIAMLKWHINYVNYAVYLLRRRFEIDVVHELINIGYPGVYDEKDDVGLNQQLDRVISLCKTKLWDLQDAEDEYKRLSKTTNGKKNSSEEFDKNIVMLGKYLGYRINQKETMMDEYCQIFNLYISENRKKETT